MMNNQHATWRLRELAYFEQNKAEEWEKHATSLVPPCGYSHRACAKAADTCRFTSAALLTELHEFDFEIDGSVEFFDSVQQCRDATDNTQPAIDWLAQREREAVVAELRDWAERWWESHSDFSAGDFNQRIAALRNQQPTACSRSEVRGKENNNA
jgi:hypothetical protein